MVDWVRRSAIVSVTGQVVFGGVSLIGFAKASPWELLFVMLLLDAIVQVIELMFYVCLICIGRLSTYFRYIDWFVTTPTMMVSTMMFMTFLDDVDATVANFVNNHGLTVVPVLIMNTLMLCFGLLGELQWISRRVSVQLGLVPLVAMFTIIYVQLPYTTAGIVILTFQFVVWSFYGLAALLDFTSKNVMYNFLDLIAKNFYGIVVMIAGFVR